ncbi:hypothetical protein K9N68_23865 [Kovacikia minuta CCNUW1]|uniref:hypothetical protein n=1 Tax=Kovacikia minuta TaxID=2931930 RepID=UPI001CCE1CF7|nr:hypothetical protein [Kovacikia minuta]UBF24685.1 hypothetical protein K9N68_23865 [Kovacikia minuta CCNUW1]
MNTSNAATSTEHFCTLFDRNYLPLGMTLHASLIRHAQPFHLWILCMDEQVEQQLNQIALPHVTLIPLKQVETPELLAVKAGRTAGEYCWTLTPFIFQAVFERDATVEQVTYLDADLFFFDHPQILLNELKQSQKHVLITEHAYAPEHEYRVPINGRYCVQFVTFRRTKAATKVMRWWQERCLQWCFNRVEEEKFGDQRYLDYWTEQFAEEVHVVQQVEKTLAPWNVNYFGQNKDKLKPVFYHYHGLRIVSPTKVRLYFEYPIGKQGLALYNYYLASLLDQSKILTSLGIPIPCTPVPKQSFSALRHLKLRLNRQIAFRSIG